MLGSGARGGGTGGTAGRARGTMTTGPHVAVARELLDLIEFSIGALRRQVLLNLPRHGAEVECSPVIKLQTNPTPKWCGLLMPLQMLAHPATARSACP